MVASNRTSEYAEGQQDPVWPQDQPLALLNHHFVPTRIGHPPPGTVPEEIVPAGVQRPKLFESLQLPHSPLKLKNRIIASPMCQYSARDGFVSPYHLAHLGSFALHGVGTIVVEASGVSAEGRITPQDVGIYNDEHVQAHASLISSLKSFTEGLTMVVQLAHAGRKASTWSPFYRGEAKNKNFVTDSEGGWEKDVLAPSALPYGEGHIVPRELTTDQVYEVIDQFVQGARRAFKAGYDGVEIHAAHGYLLHSFISPLSNKRTDEFGGSFEGRTRIVHEITSRIKKEFPKKSVWVRVSGTDWAEYTGQLSWDTESTQRLASDLAKSGNIDLLDVSSGGLVDFQKISPKPGYQVHLAEAVKSLNIPKDQMLTGSVGMLEGPDYAGELAEKVIKEDKADVIMLARGLLANPKWAEEAATELMGVRCAGNPQYHRVHPAKKPPPRPQNTN